MIEAVGSPRPNVSVNLSLLGHAGLVSRRKQGRNAFYRLKWDNVHDVLKRFFAEAGDRRGKLPLGDFSLAYQPGRVG